MQRSNLAYLSWIWSSPSSLPMLYNIALSLQLDDICYEPVMMIFSIKNTKVIIDSTKCCAPITNTAFNAQPWMKCYNRWWHHDMKVETYNSHLLFQIMWTLESCEYITSSNNKCFLFLNLWPTRKNAHILTKSPSQGIVWEPMVGIQRAQITCQYLTWIMLG